MTPDTKTCRKCKDTKVAGEFSRDAQKPDGLRSYCKPCHAAKSKATRAARPPTPRAPSFDPKRCSRCGDTKPATAFRRSVESASGLYHCCRACTAAEAKVTRARSDVKAKAADDRRARRHTVLSHYGGTCACCGEARREFLAIDHVDGGGGAHRRKINAPIVEWLLKSGLPAGFRVLCHNCNTAIGLYGSCPHLRAAPVDTKEH